MDQIRIYGTLLDPQENPIVGAEVQVTLLNTGYDGSIVVGSNHTVTATTNASGAFSLYTWLNSHSISDAPYLIEVRQSGVLLDSFRAYCPEDRSEISLSELYQISNLVYDQIKTRFLALEEVQGLMETLQDQAGDLTALLTACQQAVTDSQAQGTALSLQVSSAITAMQQQTDLLETSIQTSVDNMLSGLQDDATLILGDLTVLKNQTSAVKLATEQTALATENVKNEALAVLELLEDLLNTGIAGLDLTGQAGKYLKVKSDETGYEFGEGGSGSSFQPTRQNILSFTGPYPPFLLDGEEILVQLETFPSFLLVKFETSGPMRVRIYGTQADALADQSRSSASFPVAGQGCFGDWETFDPELTVRLGPLVLCSNQDNPKQNKVYLLLQNLSGADTSCSVSFTVLPLESL